MQTGGTLFEIDHLVVLVWGESQRDIEMATQILEQVVAHVMPWAALSQLCWATLRLTWILWLAAVHAQICLAYKPTGGRIVAVLSSRPKLHMEALFNTTIPVPKRYGSRLLFRQVQDCMKPICRCHAVSESLLAAPCAGAHTLPSLPAGVAAAAGEPGQGRRAVGRHRCRRRRLLQVFSTAYWADWCHADMFTTHARMHTSIPHMRACEHLHHTCAHEHMSTACARE